MSLKFNEATHRYWLDKKPVPSVTTLIGKGLPKEMLVRWAAKSAAEYAAENLNDLAAMTPAERVTVIKGAPFAKRDEAAVRGTDVHALAEQLVHGNEVEVPAHLADYVRGFADFIDTFAVTPVLTEKSAANRDYFYAGRFDLIADMGGTRWLLDVKTSKGVYAETALQLAAYRGCEFYVTDDDPDTEYPMPEVERVGVLHVTPDGTCLYPMAGGADPWEAWLAVMTVAKKRADIDTFRLDPIYTPEELTA